MSYYKNDLLYENKLNEKKNVFKAKMISNKRKKEQFTT